MKKINETQTIGELLNTSAFKEALGSADFERTLSSLAKHSTVFSFWGDIVGKKFVPFTKPLSIKNKKLYITAKSPIIIQELTLFKDKLLKKINSYSMPLGIEIKDIVFSYKNYKEEAPVSNEIEDKPEEIQETEFDNIVLDEKTKEQLKSHISKIAFLSDEQKDKLLNKIILSQKAKLIRK